MQCSQFKLTKWVWFAVPFSAINVIATNIASVSQNKPTLAGCEKLARGSEPIGNGEVFLNE